MRGTLICVLGVAASGLLLSACGGAEERVNDPRPPIPAAIGVSVNPGGVEVDPIRVGTRGAPRPNISQNADEPTPPANPELPEPVDVTVSNATGMDTRLILTGPERVVSPPLVAHGSTSFQAGLKPGVYMVSSPASARSSRLLVGRFRASSANDVLLP